MAVQNVPLSGTDIYRVSVLSKPMVGFAVLSGLLGN